MRRILLLITDLEIGGTPTVVREVAVRLSALPGVRVEVACLARWGAVASQLRDAGVEVTALGAHGAADVFNVVWKLVRLIRSRRFDTVVSFLIHANTAAAMASWFCRGGSGMRGGGGVRFIQSIQTTQPLPRWHWWLQRWVWHAAERVVVPSASAAQVAHEWSDVPRGMITVISNAVDPGEFGGMGVSPERLPLARRAHGRDAHATFDATFDAALDVMFEVGFIGRLDPVKRIPDLLAAIAALPDQFRLHIFGDGAQRGHIEALVDRFGITDRVMLHGMIAKPQAALARIDLLALPSEAEGFGLVLIEAMAAGVPVVATEAPGIRDVVRKDQTGLLVPVGAPRLLAEAIERIADDVSLRARLVENGLREVHDRFTWDVVLPQYMALLGAGAGANESMRNEVRTPARVESVS